MNDEHFCCNGNCTQGKTCPRYREEKGHSWAVWFYFIVTLANIAIVLLWLNGWRHG